MWVLQHYSVHAFDMSTIIVSVYLGLQVKWNQFSSKGSHAGKWPDLMTSKPDSVGTLGCHWTDRTGRPLEPQVHWDAIGTALADASTQWCSSGNPVLICIIGTHWKATGTPLEHHWNTTRSTLAFLQWHSSVHWGLSSMHTGLPLEDHWLRVRAGSKTPAFPWLNPYLEWKTPHISHFKVNWLNKINFKCVCFHIGQTKMDFPHAAVTFQGKQAGRRLLNFNLH